MKTAIETALLFCSYIVNVIIQVLSIHLKSSQELFAMSIAEQLYSKIIVVTNTAI